MFARIGRWWRAIKEFYLFALPIRFSFLALAVLAFSWLASDQGGDILRALSEDQARGATWRLIALLLLVNVCALTIWYASRHMLRYRPHLENTRPVDRFSARPTPADAPAATEWAPRWLGLFVYLIHIAGLLKVAYTYKTRGQHIDLPARYWWALLWLVVTGIAYFVFVWKRRNLFGIEKQELYRTYLTAAELVKSAKWALIGALILEVVVFAISFANPVSWYRLGVAAVVVLTITIWVPLGSALVALGEYWRFPILGALLVVAVAISPLTDNHRVRPLGDTLPARRTFDQALDDWHTRAKKLHPTGPVPMIVVATEGGGIRAAYWTATVLSTLQTQIPQFADHCVAISGVSGGSLGATVFNALLARRLDEAHAPTTADEPITAYLGPTPRSLQNETHDMLGFDALSGTLAAMAQPDLAQRWIPFVKFPDRAKALEQGWETGWREAFGGDELFSRGLVELSTHHPNLPILLLNGTVVETGDRIITSNVRLHPQLNFRNAYDGLDELQSDLRLSTAANMSTRFTYVGPAGTIPNHHPNVNRKNFGHVVDGGYFENSGSVTAAEVIAAARRYPDVQPIIIVIDYFDNATRPVTDRRPFCPTFGAAGPPPPPSSEAVGNEVMSPLRALLATRDARGSQAIGDLAQTQAVVAGTSLVEFRLLPRHVPLPLGWVLSDIAKNDIDNAMKSEGGNVTGVELLDARLKGTGGPLMPCFARDLDTDHATVQAKQVE